MSSIKLITLDTGGWVSDPLTKAIKLMEYFRASEYSQSTEFTGVHSLAYLVQQEGNNPVNFAALLQNNLNALFIGHFDAVSIQTSLDEEDSSDGLFNVNVDVKITDGGMHYSLGSMLQASNNKVIKYEIEGSTS
jgi:hypothetical protein